MFGTSFNAQMIRVRNLNGTSVPRYTIVDLPRKYKTLCLETVGTFPQKCQVDGCNNPWEATCHVFRCDIDKLWHCVAMCLAHNNSDSKQVLHVNASFVIPVNKIRKLK